MKLVMNLILVLFSFALITSVYADKKFKNQSPESLVTCQPAGPQKYIATAMSLPAIINTERCIETTDSAQSCAPCIISLENQGCRIIDVVPGEYDEYPIVTYLLSCTKP